MMITSGVWWTPGPRPGLQSLLSSAADEQTYALRDSSTLKPSGSAPTSCISTSHALLLEALHWAQWLIWQGYSVPLLTLQMSETGQSLLWQQQPWEAAEMPDACPQQAVRCRSHHTTTPSSLWKHYTTEASRMSPRPPDPPASHPSSWDAVLCKANV